MCSSGGGVCGGRSSSGRSGAEASGSGAHYALCALGVGLIALGIIMIVWTVIPIDGGGSGATNVTTIEETDEEKEKTRSSSVALVLVGVGVAMLLLSICLGVRSKRRASIQNARLAASAATQEAEPAEPSPDPRSFSVPSYEEVVGSSSFPVRQSNLRQSTSQLPSYEDIIAAVENEGAEPAAGEDTPLNEDAPPNEARPGADAPADPAGLTHNPSLPGRSSSRASRLLRPLRVRRIKSDKLHLKDFRIQIRTPTQNPVTIEPITPPPGYDPKLPELQ